MFDLNTTILVVDDMSTMRKLVMKACREIGFTKFVEAADGALGWEALNVAGASIGIIVSDWNMPNCTGIDLLKRVRGDNRFGHLPFFLVTAESEKSQILEAVQAAVSGYVVKPFTSDAIRIQLEQAYQRRVK